GLPIGDDPSVVRIESGAMHEAHPTLDLCPACTDSLGRWLERRKKKRERSHSSSSPSTSHATHSKGEGSHKSRPAPTLADETKIAGFQGVLIRGAVSLIAMLMTYLASFLRR